MAAETAGDLAIVLHSHMPYVEGFGTYPFGEEWLFDAVIRSYLPVLEVRATADDDGHPGLADQLEDAGAAARLRDFLREWRIGAAEADVREVPPSAALLARPSSPATGTRSSCSTPPEATRCGHSATPRPTGGSRSPPRRRPTRCCRCSPPAPACACSRCRDPLAPPPLRLGRRLLAARVRLRARLEWRLAEAGGALVLRRPERPCDPLDAPGAGRDRRGPVALPIDWEAISWLWSLDGYPRTRPRPVRRQIAARDAASGRSAVAPTTRTRPRRRARQAASSSPPSRRRGYAELAAAAARPDRLRDRHRAARPLVVGGGRVAGGGARRRRAPGCASSTVAEALAEHEPSRAPLGLDLGEGKDFRTWDSPPRRRPRLGRAAAGAAPAAACVAGCAPAAAAAPPASCSPSRPATGLSSTPRQAGDYASSGRSPRGC
jgi:hypothetical protein